MSIKTSFANLCSVLKEMLGNKVDKVSGKGLSTNDYTTAEKNKLAGIAAGANKITVDSALSTTSTNPVQNKVINSKCVDIENAIATNLIDTSKITSTTVYGVTRTNNGDGRISYAGTNTLTTARYLALMNDRTLSAGTYTFTHNGVANNGFVPTAYQLYKDGTYFKTIDVTKPITIDADGQYSIGAAIAKGATVDVTYRPMLERGSVAHNYVQYTGNTGTLNSDVANIVAKVTDTGWITTGNLKYRKSGYIIALQGAVTPSGSTMSITLGTLPNDCRPSQDINIAQAGTDTPSRQIIVQKGGSVVLLFASNCTASHTYAYNGTFMV